MNATRRNQIVQELAATTSLTRRSKISMAVLAAASCAALLVVSLGADQRHALMHAATPTAASGESTPPRELWVTHQRDDAISVLKFPEGALLQEFSLPAGTQPHIITFHSGAFAYISGMGNGTLFIVDANSRQLVKTLNLGPKLCHQGKVSPDGTIMLVTVFPTRRLHKVAVDEAHQSWTPLDSVEFPVGEAPVCSIFRADSQRAYVSMMPSGIAVVDVPSMTILATLPTDGFIACGMIKPRPEEVRRSVHQTSHETSADYAVVASSGHGGPGHLGHIYTLDMTHDTLVDRGTLGAASWHSLNITPDGRLGFGSSPLSDEVVTIDLTTQPVTQLGTILLQPVPGTGNNQPDGFGGGEAIVDGTLPVSLRAAGQIALIDADEREIKTFIPIASPVSPPGNFSTMTCIGCAVHGVTVRPKLHDDRNDD
jgi:DNA-binding beta-propeller fold protein YncE